MRKHLLLLNLLLLFFLVASPAFATVTSTNISASYTCTGSTGPYAFTFPISDATALEIVQNGTVLASSAYTVTPVNNDYTNGGSVTLNSACPSGTLIIQRATPHIQTSSFTEYMPTPYKTFERGLDKLIEIAQEQEDYAIANTTVQSPNFVLAGPSGGSIAGWPSFRALTMADLPSLISPTLTGPVTISGAITSGAWNATPIGIAYGGTGAATAAAAMANLGLGTAAEQNVGSLVNGRFCTYVTGTGIICTSTGTSGSSMVYPSAGVTTSDGAGWTTPYQVGTSANELVQLNASAQLPAVDGSLLTGLPVIPLSSARPLNLYIINDGTTPNTKVDLSATQVVVGGYVISNLSVVINAGTTGANGLDTGSQTYTTWYFIYAIYNPTTATGAGLLSTSATSPSLPSGYTVSRLVGSVYSDGSTHFRRFLKKRDTVQYVNTGSGLPLMVSGAAGSIFVPTYVAVAVGAFVPSTATQIQLEIYGAGNVAILVAPNANYGAYNSLTNPPLCSSGALQYAGFVFRMLLESTNIYWANNGAYSYIYCQGYEEPV